MTNYQSKNSTKSPILTAQHISYSFTERKSLIKKSKSFYAVQDVSLEIFSGETLGLVGESGCGKSTLAKILCGLLEPTSGDVYIHGKNFFNKSAHTDYKKFRKEACRIIQMIFQDPESSFNPRMRIEASVGEPLSSLSPEIEATQRKKVVQEILESVGISADQLRAFPHEFSGGQLQRAAIARALSIQPSIILCDEPTSSLDSSVQAQVLNLLDVMQTKFNLAYLFISHDLEVVRYMSDKIAVMYAGLIVEQGLSDQVFDNPLHPYTKLLLHSILSDNFDNFDSNNNSPRSMDSSGCPFSLNCPECQSTCTSTIPPLRPIDFFNEQSQSITHSEHMVRCPVALQNKS